MALRNGEHGYGLVTKSLHWLTVTALVAQFAVGYVMAGGEDSGGRHGGGEDRFASPLLPVHVGLGVAIIVLALARVAWRRTTPLPPWAPALTSRDRRLAGSVEKVLLSLLFVVPLSGLALVLSGDDDLLWLHVAAHLAFFAALAVHLSLVVRRGLFPRMT